MDHQGMELNELINKVKAELRNTGYSDSYIRGLFTVWNRLTDCTIRSGKTIFTAKVGMNFLESEYGITVFKNLDSEKKRIVPEQSIYLQITYCMELSFPEPSRQYVLTTHNFKPCSKGISTKKERMVFQKIH
jgi:hypothetical protein